MLHQVVILFLAYSKELHHMARTDITNSSSQLDTMSRGDLLHQAGLGVAALTAGTVLPGLLNAGTAHAAVSFSQGTLNVMYWYVPVAQEKRLRSVFDGFGQQHSLRVKYSSEPQSYPDLCHEDHGLSLLGLQRPRRHMAR